MKYLNKTITCLAISLITSFTALSQEHCFNSGEFLEFKVKYLNFNTSTATLETRDATWEEKPVYHIIGKGWSSRFLSFFFKIQDRFESYVDTKNLQPYHFIRDTYEGGYTKDVEINFDQENQKAEVFDKKRNTKKTLETSHKVFDMISSFYYLRNKIDPKTLKIGEDHQLNIFFDEENFAFRLKFLGREEIKTKFGKKTCLKFRPLVIADRIFKEDESLTLWVSDDKNKVPVKISAKLVVGTLTANLSKYKGLKFSHGW